VDHEKASSIKSDALDMWFAQDGTMELAPGADRPPFPRFTKNTAADDNGILFAVYFYFLLNEFKILDHEDCARFAGTIDDLTRRDASGNPMPGLYDRNPGRDDSKEALDDYRAIAAGSALFGLHYARDICEYGEKEGWIFQNIDPEKYDIKFWRQGFEVCFYKFCDGRIPAIWEFAWFCLGILFNAFQGLKDDQGVERLNTSEHLLNWITLKTIDLMPKNKKVMWMYGLIALCKWVWIWRLKAKTQGEGISRIFKIYFGTLGDGQIPPNQALSEGLVY
jgi:hypothetical protein